MEPFHAIFSLLSRKLVKRVGHRNLLGATAEEPVKTVLTRRPAVARMADRTAL